MPLGLRRRQPKDDALRQELLAELRYGGVEVQEYERQLRGALGAHNRALHAGTLYLSFRECLDTIEKAGRIAASRSTYHLASARQTAQQLVETQLFVSSLVPALQKRLDAFNEVLDNAFASASRHVEQRFTSVQEQVDLIRTHVEAADSLLAKRRESLEDELAGRRDQVDAAFNKQLNQEFDNVSRTTKQIISSLQDSQTDFEAAAGRVNHQLGAVNTRLTPLAKLAEDVDRDLKSSTSQIRGRVFVAAASAGFVGAAFGAIIALLVWVAVVT